MTKFYILIHFSKSENEFTTCTPCKLIYGPLEIDFSFFMLKTSIVILEILAKGPFFTIEPHLDKNIDFQKPSFFKFVKVGLKILLREHP